MSQPIAITQETVLAQIRFLLETQRPYDTPTAIWVDQVLSVLPDLIEDRAKLAQPVAVIRSYGHLDEYMDITRQSEEDAASRAQGRLNRKRAEFSKVEMAFEALREAIRTYYREVSV